MCDPVPVTAYNEFWGGNTIWNCAPFVIVKPLSLVTVDPPKWTSPESGSMKIVRVAFAVSATKSVGLVVTVIMELIMWGIFLRLVVDCSCIESGHGIQ